MFAKIDQVQGRPDPTSAVETTKCTQREVRLHCFKSEVSQYTTRKQTRCAEEERKEMTSNLLLKIMRYT